MIKTLHVYLGVRTLSGETASHKINNMASDNDNGLLSEGNDVHDASNGNTNIKEANGNHLFEHLLGDVDLPLRQSNPKFRTQEAMLKAACADAQGRIDYIPPSETENTKAETLRRRRMMYNKIVGDLKEHDIAKLKEVCAKRQAHQLFIRADQKLKKECDATYGYGKVVFQGAKVFETEQGTKARRTLLRRKCAAWRVHQLMLTLDTTKEEREDILRIPGAIARMSKTRLSMSSTSDTMANALEAYNKGALETSGLTLDMSYVGKPSPGRHCPCRKEIHGHTTLMRSFKLLSRYESEEAATKLLLEWGICHACIEPYLNDLCTITIWLRGSGRNGTRWPCNLWTYLGDLANNSSHNDLVWKLEKHGLKL